MTRSTIERTGVALDSQTFGGSAEVNVGSSMIVDNNNAWYQAGAGATILSLGNNQMRGNTTSTGTKTALAGQ